MATSLVPKIGAVGTLAQISTDASGATVLEAGGELIDIGMPPAALATTAWTRLLDPNDLDLFARSAEITGTAPRVSEFFKREGAAIKFSSDQINQDYCNISKSGLALNLTAGGVIGILCYVHRPNSATGITLSMGISYDDRKYASWSNSGSGMREGWNFLTIHTSEENELYRLINPADINSWDARVATVNQAQPVGPTVGHDFSTTNVSWLRLDVTGMRGTNNPTIYIEGVYFGGYAKPKITLGFDIYGSNLDYYSKPLMDQYGFKGYLAVPTGNGDVNAPEFIWGADDIARMQEYHADGWDIMPHSVSHNSLSGIEDIQRLGDEYTACKTAIEVIGCGRATDMMALPNNANDSRVVWELMSRGCKWIRDASHIARTTSLVGELSPGFVGSIALGGKTLADCKLAIDTAIKYGFDLHLYTHEVYGADTGHTDGDGTDYPSATQMYVYTFNALLEYMAAKQAAGLISVVTPYQYKTRVRLPSLRESYGAPGRIATPVGASPWTYTNLACVPVRIAIVGGTVSEIAFSSNASTFDVTGQIAGVFYLLPGEQIKVTYSSAPTAVQYRT